MKKTYLKLNIDDNHLSLGNIFRIIKELSKNKGGALQSEIFCTLFEIDSINDTTVNNYCVGCRSIGNDYIQTYLNKEKRYYKNKEEFTDNIIHLLEIIDSSIHIIDNNKIEYINSNESAYLLSKKLYNIAKNDNDVDPELINKLSSYIKDNNIYDCLVEELLFAILYKKQPIYEDELKKEVIENVLNDTSISSLDLQEYLTLKLREGINYYHSLKLLASKNNAYALFELGSNEYYGYTYLYPRYDKAYEFLKKAADLNHAGANYMIGNMYLTGLIGSKTKEELSLAYDYLLKSYNLGNIAASNSLGNMYLNGIYPLEKDLNKAIEYYENAANNDYAFAYNNLGKIEENNKNYDKAFAYFKKSADLGESWACNKVGEYYRKGIIKKDMQEAFNYYNKALDNNYHVINHYAYYNLAKYFYLNGCEEITFKDINKTKEYLSIASNNNIIEATITIFLILVEEYLVNKQETTYQEILKYKKIIETSKIYNDSLKEKIDNQLNNLKNKKPINIDFLKEGVK